MSYNNVFHSSINATLEDLRSNSQLFGVVVLVHAEYFPHTLPILPKGHPSDKIESCIKHSQLWGFVQRITLTVNMRSILHQQEGDEDFLIKYWMLVMVTYSGKWFY